MSGSGLRSLTTPGGRRRVFRYSLLSIYNAVSGQLVLAFFFGVVGMSARDANLLTVALGTGPAYYMARRWVWQRRGRSHIRREVIPFWVISIVSAVASTVAAAWSEELAQRISDSRATQTVIVVLGTMGAYGAVFVARYFALGVIFRTPHPEEDDGPTIRPGEVAGVATDAGGGGGAGRGAHHARGRAGRRRG